MHPSPLLENIYCKKGRDFKVNHSIDLNDLKCIQLSRNPVRFNMSSPHESEVNELNYESVP
jgi:hypothetical protein